MSGCSARLGSIAKKDKATDSAPATFSRPTCISRPCACGEPFSLAAQLSTVLSGAVRSLLNQQCKRIRALDLARGIDPLCLSWQGCRGETRHNFVYLSHGVKKDTPAHRVTSRMSASSIRVSASPSTHRWARISQQDSFGSPSPAELDRGNQRSACDTSAPPHTTSQRTV